jgi:predicted O-methyltransferase YrrM
LRRDCALAVQAHGARAPLSDRAEYAQTVVDLPAADYALLPDRAKRRVRPVTRPINELRALLAVRRASRRILDIEEALDFVHAFDVGGEHIASLQRRSEIRMLLERLAALQPRALVEIGTARGGTLFLLTRVAADDATIVSVDLPGGEFGGGYARRRTLLYRQFARQHQRLRLIRGDSAAPSTVARVQATVGGAIDFLFIDGDHRYDGVRRDFESYAPLVRPGGLIAIHDIVPGPVELVGDVPRFWREIRSSESQEIVDGWDQGGYGIGLLRR